MTGSRDASQLRPAAIAAPPGVAGGVSPACITVSPSGDTGGAGAPFWSGGSSAGNAHGITPGEAPGPAATPDPPLIRRRWPQVRVIGVELSHAQLVRARRVLADDLATGAVVLVRGDATDVPLRAAVADAAFVCWLLEHVPDPTPVLRECARV